MSDANQPAAEAAGNPGGASIDPVKLEHLRRQLLSEQNLAFGLAAGLVASLIGAAAWATFTFASGYQIGFMAIGIGFLVGYAVRATGKGITSIFGVAGAALALLGCALGNLLAVTAIVADSEGVAFSAAVSQLTPALAQELMVAFFSPMDVVFYAIAAYEGYKLSFRQLDGEDLQRRLGPSGG